MTEMELVERADDYARAYLATVETRAAFPPAQAIAALSAFDEALPVEGRDAAATLDLLDRIGSPATTTSNGPNYFGFVIGASLPAAAAADRLALAWDQCASSSVNSPAAAALEKVASSWLLDILDLPRDSAVGFGTSATACGLACLATARRALLLRAGWDLDRDGIFGAPEIRVVVPATVHITIKKALRILGFGDARIVRAPVDAEGRVDPMQLPALDDKTILCLQAGEVNTGSFDPFADIIPRARQAGAWVHVDGAFGLWARASSRRPLTAGIEDADSWTTDGHKWLNTPYDCAVAVCRDCDTMTKAMASDAPYLAPAPDAQRNLTMEFSRRARGISVWAALRTLGRRGVAEMVDRHCDLAADLATQLRAAGFEVLNAPVLNQVLVRCAKDELTARVRERAIADGEVWFGMTTWADRPAFRISISSWRTQRAHVDRLARTLTQALHDAGG